MRSKEKPYILLVAELIYLKICDIKKINPEFSNINAIETFIGSAELINLTKNSPKNLREAVTSPGGTTEAGLELLKKIEIDRIIFEMMAEAVQRGNDLAKESNK